MQDFSDFRCPFLSKEEIWLRAKEFRATYWHENVLPVDIESIIEKKMKLNIEPEHGLLVELDIDAFLRSDLTGIVVDYKCYMDERFSNRLRFSYAHEIGHLRLHKVIYDELSLNNSEEWKQFIETVPEREYGYFEYQANEFAGRLLVPRQVLITELEKVLDEIRQLNLLEYLKQDPGSVLARISPALCKPFSVSYDVIERRLEREGLWPPKI